MRRNSKSRIDVFQEYVQRYGVGGTETSAPDGGTSRDWTPYRLCAEDWILAAWAARCTKTRYDVGFFAAEDHADYDKDAGLKGALIMLLSDAYRKTGKMAIAFRGPRRDEEASLETGFCGQVPKSIRLYAEQQGVAFENHSRITDEEGRKLYARIAGLRPDLVTLLEQCSLDPVHVAFLVLRGIWDALGVELLTRHSLRPQALLAGAARPENWLFFSRDLVLLRLAVMAERVRTLFETAGEGPDPARVDCRWTDGPIVACTPAEPVRLARMFGAPLEVKAGETVYVRLAPREKDGYNLLFLRDLQPAQAGSLCGVATTKDFDWTADALRRHAEKTCSGPNLSLLQIVDTLDELDAECMTRLARCATTRTAIEEQRE